MANEMSRRLVFIFVLLFWLAMNGLLVYREFGGGASLGEEVPLEIVWEKILQAPDPSILQVNWRGLKAGYVRWAPNIVEAPGLRHGADEEALEGRIRDPSGYTLDLEANILWNSPTNRLRGSSHVDFNTKGAWEVFTARLHQRPGSWEVTARAGHPSLILRYEMDSSVWEKEISYDTLKNPQALLGELGLPVPLLQAWIGPLLPQPLSPGTLAEGLRWSARQDWMQIGHSRVRIYRVQARILDRYQVVVLISRVGEILKVEVPNEMLMLNEAIAP